MIINASMTTNMKVARRDRVASSILDKFVNPGISAGADADSPEKRLCVNSITIPIPVIMYEQNLNVVVDTTIPGSTRILREQCSAAWLIVCNARSNV